MPKHGFFLTCNFPYKIRIYDFVVIQKMWFREIPYSGILYGVLYPRVAQNWRKQNGTKITIFFQIASTSLNSLSFTGLQFLSKYSKRNQRKIFTYHCVKAVHIRSLFWAVFFRIQPNAGKYVPENSEYGHLSGSARLIVEWVLRGLNVRAKHKPGFI